MSACGDISVLGIAGALVIVLLVLIVKEIKK